jgi:hypothetical protein
MTTRPAGIGRLGEVGNVCFGELKFEKQAFG